jgi:hypothetical protein
MAAHAVVLSPQRTWRAIALATVVLMAAFWSLLAGLVALGSDAPGGPQPAPAIAIGLALVPVVFVLLAWLSGVRHPRRAVLRAVGVFVAVGVPVSAIAADAVTGFVAAAGAGAMCALAADDEHSRRARVVAVVAATLYTFVLVRTAGTFALVFAPIFPLTGLGVADHLSEGRHSRA